MPKNTQPKNEDAALTVKEAQDTAVSTNAEGLAVGERIEGIEGDEGVESADTHAPVIEQAVQSNDKTEESKLQEIDLSEIDAYLKTLVPSVLGMSENLVVLGDKLKGLINEMGQRVKTVDTSVNRYELLILKKNKLIQMILLGSVGAIFLALATMFVAGLNYSSQVNQMNALSISLARRLAEVNSGLVTFEQLNQSIATLGDSTERLMIVAETQSDTLGQALASIESQLALASTQLDESLVQWQSSVSSEMTGLLQDTRSSSAGIVRAIEQVGAAQRGLLETTPTLRELVALREQISALIVLQRNQYLETIAAAQARQLPAVDESAEPPPSPLQYRRDPK